jgi:hypothetical protein
MTRSLTLPAPSRFSLSVTGPALGIGPVVTAPCSHGSFSGGAKFEVFSSGFERGKLTAFG